MHTTTTNKITITALATLCAAALASLSGCAGMGGGSGASAPASAPAASTGARSGMDAAGNVVDSSQVSSGSGRQVQGINGFSGEITGKPARNSRFTRLKIGMPAKQVTDLIGQPTDQGAYLTGKAWIPFYFGSDRHRYEMVYKNQGRLIFAGGSIGDLTGANLIWIIHNANEPGYR